MPLQAVESESDFGGKAFRLGVALRAGLPVPPGFALSVDQVTILATDDRASGHHEAALTRVIESLGGRVAVRSSAVGEDAADASFAGQHATVLDVRDAAGLVAAVAEIWRSARADAALAYRQKLGIDGAPRIAAVIQELVEADVAGVLFTVNPLTGADERVVEAAWGLGEAVVAGLVTPDHYRMLRDGTILERRPGDKEIAVRSSAGGGTVEVEVAPDLVRALCLDDAALAELGRLAGRCEVGASAAVDLEFAFAGSRLFLLQRRDVTRSR